MLFNPLHDASRLQMQSLYNARDLGGLPTQDGQVTAFGRFVRSDAPVQLTTGDRIFLLHYPVRMVIDLRCDNELRDCPNDFSSHPGIEYHHIPILGEDLDTAMAAIRPISSEARRAELSDLYILAIEQAKGAIGQVFSLMAGKQDGTVLFHCTLGKDRTGLVAALLQLLAGVGEEWIIGHYAVSEVYLKPYYDTFIHNEPAEHLHFFNSDPQNMVRTLAFFNAHYASAADYLAQCGLTNQMIEALRQKMLHGK